MYTNKKHMYDNFLNIKYKIKKCNNLSYLKLLIDINKVIYNVFN